MATVSQPPATGASLNWKRLSFWQRLDRVPPALIRIMARATPHSRHPAPTKTIAQKSGLSEEEVILISSKVDARDWDGVALGTARKFLQGCGVDLANSGDVVRLRRQIRRMKRRPSHRRFLFVAHSPESDYLTNLLERYREAVNRAPAVHKS